MEALYADLGHFGPAAIRISWCVLVFPALVTNYLGQAALLINDPSTFDAPFYKSVPKPLFWPMLILATMSTIIASQALITGTNYNLIIIFRMLLSCITCHFFSILSSSNC